MVVHQANREGKWTQMMISKGDTIVVYDIADDRDVEVSVLSVGETQLVKAVPQSDDGHGDDVRVYPDEQWYRREYSVLVEAGRKCLAVAEWVGESNESNAFIHLADDGYLAERSGEHDIELTGAELLHDIWCDSWSDYSAEDSELEFDNEWIAGLGTTFCPALISGDRALALDDDERDDEGRLIYLWAEYVRSGDEWEQLADNAGTEAHAREAVERWLKQ